MRLCLKLAARIAPRPEAVKFRARLPWPSRRPPARLLAGLMLEAMILFQSYL
jgi:hypothetical protein